MKRLCALFLCLVLVLSFAACGDSEEPSLTADELKAMGVDAAADVLLEYSIPTPNHLISRLEWAGYAIEEATDAVKAVDWKEQAPHCASYYLENIYHHSHSGLIEAMVREGYSKEEATYGVDNCGADWKEQAVKRAKYWIEEQDHPLSYMGTIHHLTQIADFTLEQATYGADNCGIDWKVQAAKLAMNCKDSGDTYFDAVSYLEYVGFTPEEIEYGALTAFGHK